MNLDFNLSWNNFLYLVRKTFFRNYKYYCNICGYPTNDINKLHAHGLRAHSFLMRKHLVEYDDFDNMV